MSDQPAKENADPPAIARRFTAHWAQWIGILLLIYVAVAYLLMPLAWKRYTHRHPELDHVPRITLAANGVPGDPLNVALIGSEDAVKRIMLDARWYPADPLTLRSCLKIASATVLKRPYAAAPVSNLFLFGRREDLAFEKPVGDNPRQRNHVRFWKCAAPAPDGRPIWIGAATFDDHVGLSHRTGQITHHIAGDVDAERDTLMRDLQATRKLSEVESLDGFHQVLQGRNGGGDLWKTDGRLLAGSITED